MRSVLARALILGVALVGSCKPDPFRPDAPPEPEDTPPPLWWKPTVGEAVNWDIQLAKTPFDVSAPRAMYALDLWDAVPTATMLDYGGSALMVPAGSHGSAIMQLHAQTPPAIVVCVVGTGAIRLGDPDAVKFPGYKAAPPNRQTPPEPGSVIGWSTTETDVNERFIDINDAARTVVGPLIQKRIDLAKMIGCDAIAAKNNDLPAYEGAGQLDHGFAPISYDEYVSWSKALSDYAHDRLVSIGAWNKSSLGADDLAAMYDWNMVERCAEFSSTKDCVPGRPFLNQFKAVFAIEYDQADDGTTNNTDTLCSFLRGAGITSGIIKKAALDSFRMDCP